MTPIFCNIIFRSLIKAPDTFRAQNKSISSTINTLYPVNIRSKNKYMSKYAINNIMKHNVYNNTYY